MAIRQRDAPPCKREEGGGGDEADEEAARGALSAAAAAGGLAGAPCSAAQAWARSGDEGVTAAVARLLVDSFPLLAELELPGRIRGLAAVAGLLTGGGGGGGNKPPGRLLSVCFEDLLPTGCGSSALPAAGSAEPRGGDDDEPEVIAALTPMAQRSFSQQRLRRGEAARPEKEAVPSRVTGPAVATLKLSRSRLARLVAVIGGWHKGVLRTA